MLTKWFYRVYAILTQSNTVFTPEEVILDQMKEPRPLPLGRKDFEDWSDRLIAGAMIPGGEEEPERFKKGQKFALADMILHCKPTESHVPDAHFIHSLRKMAANQVALMMKNEIHTELKPAKEENVPLKNVVKDMAKETELGNKMQEIQASLAAKENIAQPNLSVVKEGI